MPIVLKGISSPPLESSPYLLHPPLLLSSAIYPVASIFLIIIGALLLFILFHRLIRHSLMSNPPLPSGSYKAKKESQTTPTASSNPSTNMEVSLRPKDHVPLFDSSKLPKPTIRPSQEHSSSTLQPTRPTATSNTTRSVETDSNTVTRHDVIQNINGCRRHVIIWG